MAEHEMVHMERSHEERVADAPTADGPMYSYGLRIRLEKEELEKLGVEELPEVGDELHIQAVGMVCSVSSNKYSEKDDGHVCVEVQLTHMGAVEEGHEEDGRPAGKLYPNRDNENSEY